MNTISCTVLATLLAGGIPALGMLYHTGFEEHCFVVDAPLDGQDGWVGLIAEDAAVIVRGRDTAASGRHAVECWGGDLESIPMSGLVDGAWEQVIPFDPTTRPSVVRVEADIRLDGPDTGSGPNDDLLSANLYARNGTGRSAFFFLSSNGNAYAFANSENGSKGYQFETPIRIGCYNNLAITLNYKTHIATFEVNRKVIGSLPFGGAGEQWRGVLLEMAAWDDPSFDRELYTSYFDNVSVRAKPAKK